MKKLFFLTLFLNFIVIATQAQFKIADRIIQSGFNSDTATVITIKCVSIDIKTDSKAQRPVFYLAFLSKSGKVIDDQNVGYDDMVRACKKNNIPVAQYETIINQSFSAVLCGTKPQKLAAIRALLAGYNITLRPDEEQL